MLGDLLNWRGWNEPTENAKKEESNVKWWEDDDDLPGNHPRWDPGAENWSKWRKTGVAHGDGGIHVGSSGLGASDFAIAVEDSPLLDEDALILRSAGYEVVPEGKCVRFEICLHKVQ